MFPGAEAAAAGPEDLASVRRLLRSSPTPAEINALVDAVTGAPGSSGVAARDTDAYQFLSLGYSAQETADVVSGRIGRRALDTARRMLAAGQRSEVVEGHLDRHFSTLLAQQSPPPDSSLATPAPRERPGGRPRDWPSRQFDALIAFYAARYHVDAALVRAMIATESGFDRSARSPKGAIGLMQLMPPTARALGVNPWVAHENIEGGVRYVAEMLRTFGSTELALYGETRDYVRNVLARVTTAAY